MVMMAEPIYDCLHSIGGRPWRVMVSSRGKVFSQKIAQRLAAKRHLVFICGHYEGIDERVHEHLVDEEISAGDFVTTGGEFPALCFIDAVMRLVPGALGNQASLDHESFTGGTLDFPHYTRPREFKGWKVPQILFSGDHARVAAWRSEQALRLTKRFRSDLLKNKKVGGCS